MKNITYLTPDDLERLNTKAIKSGKNRCLTDEFINERMPRGDVKFPVGFNMIHNDVEVRCSIAVGDDLSVWLDMDVEDFVALPMVSM